MAPWFTGVNNLRCPNCGQEAESTKIYGDKRLFCKPCKIIFNHPETNRMSEKICKICDKKFVYIKEMGWDKPPICDGCIHFILNRKFDVAQQLEGIHLSDGD